MKRLHRTLGLLALPLAASLVAAACSSSEVDATGDDATAAVGAETTTSAAASTASIGTGAGTEPAETTTTGPDTGGELYPDVVGATAVLDADGTWTVSATLSSPYDSPQRYADAWRVLGPDGTVYGTRELAHDHANEQPFTRSQGGIAIPDDVDRVTIEGRDQVSGWGGQTFELVLER